VLLVRSRDVIVLDVGALARLSSGYEKQDPASRAGR